MRVLTVSNLYPRPDQPQRGLFNAQQFRALAEALEKRGTQAGGQTADGGHLTNICLVPEWRVWRWARTRAWADPFDVRMGTRYVPVFYLPAIGRGLSWRTYAAALRGEREAFDACDAVLATWLYPDAVAAAALARQCRKRLWIKVHGTDRFHLRNPGRRRHILAACDQAEGVICVGESVAAALRGAGVAAGKIGVVSNGADAGRFRFRSRAESRASLAAPEGPTVLYVGNLLRIKGPDVLLDAWPFVRRGAGAGNPRLVLVGEGPMRRALERKANRLGIADSVAFLGPLAHGKVALWMNAADCLCLPSRSEGMPNAVIEALASGLPVVAADVGSCRELLQGEDSARLAPPGDAAALGRALSEVLALRTDRPGMAERGAARFSWERSAEQLLQILERQAPPRRVRNADCR